MPGRAGLWETPRVRAGGGRLMIFLCGPCRYSPKSPALQSETVHYKRGVSQQFSLPSFKIDFSEWKDDEVTGPRPGPGPSQAPSPGGQHCGPRCLRPSRG